MTDFVFLHGSFHAAWNWHKAAGHSPFFSCPDRLAELLVDCLDTFGAVPARAAAPRRHSASGATIDLEGAAR